MLCISNETFEASTTAQERDVELSPEDTVGMVTAQNLSHLEVMK